MIDSDSSDFFTLLDALHVFTGRGHVYAQFFVDRCDRAKEALGRAMDGVGEDELVPVERIAAELDLAMREGVA